MQASGTSQWPMSLPTSSRPRQHRSSGSCYAMDTGDYLAGVATWADSIRYTKWGHFTGPFHFIDAKDTPPLNCSVDYERGLQKRGLRRQRHPQLHRAPARPEAACE